MAIIYTYPQINSSSDLAVNDLMIISDMSANGRPTKSLTLKNLADFVTSTGTGTGTTNKIIKWSDGPAGLLGDSIMNEDVDKIYVDGQLRIGSSSGASRIQIFHDVLDSDNTFSSGGATGSQIIGRRNELYIENRGASRGDIIFKANNGENNGSVDTYFLLDASMADIGTSAKYTRWPDQSRIVLGNSSNVNSLDFEMYHDGGTGLKNGASNLSITSKGGIFIENETGGEIEIHNNINSDFNIRSEGDIKLKGSGGAEYFRVDSGVGEAIFYKQAQVPLVPTANAHATSKQYLDNLVARKIFTATSLDTTTNYNSSPAGTQTPIVWNSELIKDSIYTHDNAVNPEQVTVTEAGTYRIYSMLTATSVGTRAQVLLKIAINGTARARFGAEMYIRNSSGHNKSSSTIEETIVLSANDIITITGERGSSITTAVYNISEASYFSIEKIA